MAAPPSTETRSVLHLGLVATSDRGDTAELHRCLDHSALFHTDADSFTAWGEYDPRAPLHVTTTLQARLGDRDDRSDLVRARLAAMAELIAGLPVRLADYAMVTDAADWSTDQLLVTTFP